jgi:hypothetical protein
MTPGLARINLGGTAMGGEGPERASSFLKAFQD